jgi:hypothetical protein
MILLNSCRWCWWRCSLRFSLNLLDCSFSHIAYTSCNSIITKKKTKVFSDRMKVKNTSMVLDRMFPYVLDMMYHQKHTKKVFLNYIEMILFFEFKNISPTIFISKIMNSSWTCFIMPFDFINNL